MDIESKSQPSVSTIENSGTKTPSEEALSSKRQFYKLNEKYHPFVMCSQELYFNEGLNKKLGESVFNKHTLIDASDSDRKSFSALFEKMRSQKVFNAKILKLSLKHGRSIGAVMGMAIADALGASTQFESFTKEGLGIVKQGFYDIHAAILAKKLHARSGTVGIWTDDASMGLSMADSVLLTDYHFNPQHIRYLFTLWLEHGLNNGGRAYSIGLGGNISISMYEFMKEQKDYTEQGDRFNNGNGSLMRLAPIPVAYSDDLKKGMQYSALQSFTTHNGIQASQCSRLMANIIIELINRGEKQDGKKLLLKVCDNFKSKAKSVEFLAKGKQQTEELYKEQCDKFTHFEKFNKTVADRNWNWREKTHTYSKSRFENMPGYIGSYCMDALSMALHTVLFSSSFTEVVCKNADMGGDCDTVGSIAGQIAGAMYGVDDGMMKLYSQMEDFKTERYEVFLKAYKLATKQKLELVADKK